MRKATDSKGPVRSGRAFLLICIAVLCSAATTAEARRPAHLHQNPEDLRYRFEEASIPQITPNYLVTADFSGDGIQEEMKIARAYDGSANRQLVDFRSGIPRTAFQVNFPLAGGIAGVLDVDGDGRPEAIDWRQNLDGTISISVISISYDGQRTTEKTLGKLSWDATPWLRPNGLWSGAIWLISAIDEDGDGTRETLILAVSAGFSRLPRGVWKCNWETSEFIWQLHTGATPTGDWAVVDIDNDGRREIVLGLESPCNRVSSDRWDDFHAYVAAITLDGEILWHREIGGRSAQVCMVAADLDLDGSLEVSTAICELSVRKSGSAGVAVLRGKDGEKLAWLCFGCDVTDLLEMKTPEGPRLYASGDDGVLRRLAFEGGSLAVEYSVDCGHPVTLIDTVRFRPPLKADGIMVLLAGGKLVLFDRKLSPLAMLDTPDSGDAWATWISPATFEIDGSMVDGTLVSTGTVTHTLYLTRSPMKTETKIAIAAAVGLALFVGVPNSRQTSLAALRRAVTPRSERGALVDELLSALSTASHGRLAATSTFRRLRMQMELLAGSDEAPEALEERFSQAVRDVREIGIPGVGDIRARATRLGLATRAATALASSLAALDKTMTVLPERMPDRETAGRLRYRLDAALKPIEDELLEIRRAAEHERSDDLMRTLGSALGARKPDIESLGIELDVRGLDTGDELRILATPLEAGFILENLLGNAVEAVKEAPHRRIELAATVRDQYAVVTVSDTGRGIPRSQQEAIFSPGVSSRDGGGHGLSKSREILGTRGGSIRLLRSGPGEGSVFEVSFRLCS